MRSDQMMEKDIYTTLSPLSVLFGTPSDQLWNRPLDEPVPHHETSLLHGTEIGPLRSVSPREVLVLIAHPICTYMYHRPGSEGGLQKTSLG